MGVLDDDAKGGRGGRTGGPMYPGSSGPPKALDRPAHGTFPLVHDHPTKGKAKTKVKGMGGDCCRGMK